MFGKLKEKLKNWAKRVSEKEPVEEKPEIVEETIKEEKEEILEEPIKEEIKEIPIPTKFEVATQKIEPDLEKLEEKTIELEKEIEKREEKNIEETIKELEKETKEEGFLLESRKETTIEKPKKESFFKKISSKITKVKISEKEFEVYSEELETLLLENNVALEITEKIIKELKERIVGKELLKKEIESEIYDCFKEIIDKVLIEPFNIIEKINEKKDPYIILFCGINGTGKTTTIAKIADHLKRNGISSVIAAADTFRAASIEQIKKHGEKLGIKVTSQDYGSDPAAVAFDAIKYAKKNFIKAALIDTAGRMHTSKNLLKEIEKISKVCKPDLKIFVGESITGNDIIEQVKSFDWAIGIDAIVLTKADIDEKGGTALSVGYTTKKPILYLGTGQEYDAVEVFDKEKFIKKLGL